MKFKESRGIKWDNGYLYGFVIFIIYRCNMDKIFDLGL